MHRLSEHKFVERWSNAIYWITSNGNLRQQCKFYGIANLLCDLFCCSEWRWKSANWEASARFLNKSNQETMILSIKLFRALTLISLQAAQLRISYFSTWVHWLQAILLARAGIEPWYFSFKCDHSNL